jgi:hypothetical protein
MFRLPDTSAFVSICQHLSAYVSIRQHIREIKGERIDVAFAV